MEYTGTSAADHRRIRRMISNRESARRSRMRRQRHIEDLRRRIDRHRFENRALADRFAAVSRCCAALSRENERLAGESAGLLRRLSEIRRALFLRQLERLSPPPVAAGDGIFGADEQMLGFFMA